MSLTMTELAAQEVANYKTTVQAPPESFLRVRITAGGCSGHSFSLTLDKRFDENKDSKYNFYGQDLVVDKKSELYLEGATLIYKQGLERSGFDLDMPMAKKTCGCGSSFQF